MKLTRDDLEDRAPGEEDYRALWEESVGCEEVFYVACAEVVRSLDTETAASILDANGGRELLDEAKVRYEALVFPTLATSLVLTRDLRCVRAPGGVRVTTYSTYDPLFLTQDLWDALSLFREGETVDDALARLSRDHDVQLPRELLLEMQLHGVMTPVSPAS
jgi:hypothetical protein